MDARDAACGEIREDIALSHGRGVRASSRARRHLRDCKSCRDYRSALRTTRSGFGALIPGHAGLFKVLGIGGGSAAAGGGAAAGGSAIVVGGGVSVTAAKVAAIVCCAAVVGTGAEVVQKQIATPAKKPAAAAVTKAPAPAVRASAASVALSAPIRHRERPHHSASKAVRRHTGAVAAPSEQIARALHGVPAIPVPVTVEEVTSGGALAPDEVEAITAPATDAPSDTTAVEDSQAGPSTRPAQSPPTSAGASAPTATPAAAPPTESGGGAPAAAPAGEASAGGVSAPPAD
jgi:hypothetical protein